jgi:hypothetical protein
VSQFGSWAHSKFPTVDGNDSLWLAVVGSGRQWFAMSVTV